MASKKIKEQNKTNIVVVQTVWKGSLLWYKVPDSIGALSSILYTELIWGV